MNLNRLIAMLTRRLTNWGVNKGIDLYSRRSGGVSADGKLSPAAQKQAKTARQAAKRARQAARITRRLR
ncbi:hypothetical protein SAMN05444389_101169 [Paracoccus solventivorans]|uniref:Uncharacterized protein n=1 Tax=Paracoccus solventivorans TaxID=53463 RepID=A0A1M7D6M5_9RHOB|nr:hypothetical protein [Paracoccus solventivorans]SHL75033.1 hypothetical protein SAMN05444389_101169 [Paracoccus solventivorans]